MSLSKYYESLTGDYAAGYREKLSVINDKDPFKLDKTELDPELVPPLSYEQSNVYMRSKFRPPTPSNVEAYHKVHDKALQLALEENVYIPGAATINDHVVVVAKVEDSPVWTDPSNKVWIIFKKNADVLTAHCTCLKDFSDICGHISAVLCETYWEALARWRDHIDESPAGWIMPNIDDDTDQQVCYIDVSQLLVDQRGTKRSWDENNEDEDGESKKFHSCGAEDDWEEYSDEEDDE